MITVHVKLFLLLKCLNVLFLKCWMNIKTHHNICVVLLTLRMYANICKTTWRLQSLENRDTQRKKQTSPTENASVCRFIPTFFLLSFPLLLSLLLSAPPFAPSVFPTLSAGFSEESGNISTCWFSNRMCFSIFEKFEETIHQKNNSGCIHFLPQKRESCESLQLLQRLMRLLPSQKQTLDNTCCCKPQCACI